MCIALISTAHPEYPFILLSNRDEVLARPTSHANWWDAPNTHVLGGRDLQRSERGTWLGITRQGRIAVLTNFRDEGVEVARDKSRGGIVNAYLTASPNNQETAEQFAQRLMIELGIQDVGGFSLLYGRLRPAVAGCSSECEGEKSLGELSILSNRTESADKLAKLCGQRGETHGLSNTHYGDRSWPKILQGEQLLKQTITADIDGSSQNQDNFLASLFKILDIDAMPARVHGQPWHEYTRQMRNSILIPPVGGEAVAQKPADELASAKGGTDSPRVNIGEGAYGTQKQTIILIDNEGKVLYVERTLYDELGNAIADAERERRFEFVIEPCGTKKQGTKI